MTFCQEKAQKCEKKMQKNARNTALRQKDSKGPKMEGEKKRNMARASGNRPSNCSVKLQGHAKLNICCKQ